MKERPKAGDRVEFFYRRVPRTGMVIAVAETGVHFLIEAPKTKHMVSKNLPVPLSKIIRILPKVTWNVEACS